jgi:multiple antibiotic resistance protein
MTRTLIGTSLQHYVLALFATANNVAAIPLFLALTRGLTPKQHLKVCNIATLTSFATMVVSLFTGVAVLNFFEIGIPAFRIAGGLLLLRTGFSMMSVVNQVRSESPVENANLSEIISTAIIPIGIPLTTGPGTMSTIILFSSTSTRDLDTHLMILIAIAIVTAVIWLSFLKAPIIARVLRSTGLDVLTKIFGLITLALGVQFILTGLSTTFPNLLG